MPHAVAQWITLIVAAYLGLGVLFAVVFVSKGVQRIDPAARGAPVFFRALILPGVAALWPLLLGRWLAAQPHDEPAS